MSPRTCIRSSDAADSIASPRDLVVLRTVRARPASSALGDVSHDRFRGPEQLVDAFCVAARNSVRELGDVREELYGALADVKALEAEHARDIDRPARGLLRRRTQRNHEPS